MKTFETMVDSRLGEDGPFASCNPDAPVTQSQLSTLERYLDSVWGALDLDIAFTRHFLDRVNDPRNGRQITVCELQKVFTDAFKRHGASIAKMAKTRPDIEGIIKSATTKINTPFALNWNGDEFSIVTKTVMRKDRFTSSPSNRLFHVEGNRDMGPFEKQVNETLGEPLRESTFVAPPKAKSLGFTHLMVPDKCKYGSSYGAYGFKNQDDAEDYAGEHFGAGYKIYPLAQYTAIWSAGGFV